MVFNRQLTSMWTKYLDWELVVVYFTTDFHTDCILPCDMRANELPNTGWNNKTLSYMQNI